MSDSWLEWPDSKVVAVITDGPDKIFLFDVAAPHLHVLLQGRDDGVVDELLEVEKTQLSATAAAQQRRWPTLIPAFLKH